MQQVHIYDKGIYYGPQNTYNPQISTQVPYPNTQQNVWPHIQAQNQEAYRQLRSHISGKGRVMGAIYCSLGILLVVIGAIGIYYGAPDMPYVLPLHIVTGVMLFTDGLCAFMAGQQIQTEDSVSGKIKCLLFAVYCLSLAGISVCFVTAAINGVMGVVFCLGVEYSRSGNIQRENDQCTVNKEENIILSSVIIGVCVLAGILCILVTCFFCAYGRVLGITTKRTRVRM